MGVGKWFRGVRRDFGVVPLCNGKRERAPDIGGFCLPLCWRCASVAGSTVACCALHLAAPIDYSQWEIGSLGAAAAVFTLPMLWDGWMQYGRKRESTNSRRIVTGALCGIGLWFVANLLLAVLE